MGTLAKRPRTFFVAAQGQGPVKPVRPASKSRARPPPARAKRLPNRASAPRVSVQTCHPGIWVGPYDGVGCALWMSPSGPPIVPSPWTVGRFTKGALVRTSVSDDVVESNSPGRWRRPHSHDTLPIPEAGASTGLSMCSSPTGIARGKLLRSLGDSMRPGVIAAASGSVPSHRARQGSPKARDTGIGGDVVMVGPSRRSVKT